MFITIEGGEGSGKTTLIRSLESFFKERGEKVLLTREPGGTPLGDKIRELLLETADHRVSNRAEVLLFLASRAEHVEDVIKPALKSGKVVLCDRFIDSTAAYQGYARGLGIQEMLHLSQFSSDNLEPELTLYLDIPPVEGLARAKKVMKSEKNDRIEGEKMVFHEKVRRGFLTLADLFPKRIHVLDARKPADQVLLEAIQVIEHVQSPH